jgi:hypothetical protein
MIKRRFAFQEDEEEYRLVAESKKFLIYVSDKGRVYRKEKKTRKLIEYRYRLDNRGNKSVRFLERTHSVKNLVARYFIEEYRAKDIVETISDDPMDCSIYNLKVIPREKFFQSLQQSRVSVPVVIKYPDGRKEYCRSIKECSQKVNYDSSGIAKMLKGKRNVELGCSIRRTKKGQSKTA